MFRSFVMRTLLDEVRNGGGSVYATGPTSPVETVAYQHAVSADKLHAEVAAFGRAQDSGRPFDFVEYLTAAVATAASCTVGGTQHECDRMMSLRDDVERVAYLMAPRSAPTLNDL